MDIDEISVESKEHKSQQNQENRGIEGEEQPCKEAVGEDAAPAFADRCLAEQADAGRMDADGFLILGPDQHQQVGNGIENVRFIPHGQNQSWAAS